MEAPFRTISLTAPLALALPAAQSALATDAPEQAAIVKRALKTLPIGN